MASTTVGQSHRPHVLIFPFPAQGHMLPLLDLTAHLSRTYSFSVTLIVTPKNLPMLNPLLSISPSVTPLVLPFPSSPSIPSGVENLKDLPPSYFSSMMFVLSNLKSPILHWARQQISPPCAIIYDFFLGWVKDAAQELGIPGIVFSPSAATTISVHNCLWREMPQRGDPNDECFPIGFPKLPKSPVYPWYQVSSLFRSHVKGDLMREFIKEGFLKNIESWGFVFNTFAELEKPWLDHLKCDLGHDRVWAVGPLSQPGDFSAEVADRGGPNSVPAKDVMAWLDGCDDASVVYACFGSQVVLNKSQTEAVATGLEKSGVPFIWCVKSGTAVDSGESDWGLPEGFEERVASRGLVIKGWAPQVAILGHRAVGSFFTHCGWNSVLEGISAGMVLVVWPMGADQFMSARLVEEDAGVAIRVCERRDGVPDPQILAQAVADSIDRNRSEWINASELKRKALATVKEGGSSYRDLGALAEVLSKLNAEKK